ncbi:hypothetical protein ACFO5Q_05805 [Kordiimonas lipolytica]|uniref:Uncharacterized protein n=1 Tax=Kordiimonas lipolytica TaxID=1662421 RepID=A0ABV8UA38_9PROT|nr:hypothetical protein [Kordiimonas lipolytica]
MKQLALALMIFSSGGTIAECPTLPPLPKVDIQDRHEDMICRAAEVDWSAVTLTIAQLKKSHPTYKSMSIRDFIIQTYCAAEYDEYISLIKYTATHSKSYSNAANTMRAVAAALGPDLLRVDYNNWTHIEWAMAMFEESTDDRYLAFSNVVESELKRHGVQPDRIKACSVR